MNTFENLHCKNHHSNRDLNYMDLNLDFIQEILFYIHVSSKTKSLIKADIFSGRNRIEKKVKTFSRYFKVNL
jgi:hypothetical protein